MRKEQGTADGRAQMLVGSSGNVFEDLGIPHPEEALAKARLAESIADTIQRRGLLQTEAGKMFGIDQPKVSRIVNGRLDGFSQDRLMRYLRILGDDVEITIRRPRRYGKRGDLTVTVEVVE